MTSTSCLRMKEIHRHDKNSPLTGAELFRLLSKIYTDPSDVTRATWAVRYSVKTSQATR